MCGNSDVIDLSPDGGYIGKQTLEETGIMYLEFCFWSLEVKAGQKISFTVFSFLYGQARGTRAGNKQLATGKCLFYSNSNKISMQSGSTLIDH